MTNTPGAKTRNFSFDEYRSPDSLMSDSPDIPSPLRQISTPDSPDAGVMTPSASFPQSVHDSVPKPKLPANTQLRFSFMVDNEDMLDDSKDRKPHKRESIHAADNYDEPSVYITPPSRLDNVPEEPPSPETPVPAPSKRYAVASRRPSKKLTSASKPVLRPVSAFMQQSSQKSSGNPQVPPNHSRLSQAERPTGVRKSYSQSSVTTSSSNIWMNSDAKNAHQEKMRGAKRALEAARLKKLADDALSNKHFEDFELSPEQRNALATRRYNTRNAAPQTPEELDLSCSLPDTDPCSEGGVDESFASFASEEESTMVGDLVMRDAKPESGGVITNFVSALFAPRQTSRPCTQATEADSQRLKHAALQLSKKYDESQQVYSYLMHRLERMIQRDYHECERERRHQIPLRLLARNLRDWLRETANGRIQHGEGERYVQHEIEWAEWIHEAAWTGVLHIKSPECECRSHWKAPVIPAQ